MTISLGGAGGSVGFTDDAQGVSQSSIVLPRTEYLMGMSVQTSFADEIWNLYLGTYLSTEQPVASSHYCMLGGTSTTRPFGDAVLDGVDLDIEGGGGTGYAAFISQIRSHANGANKP